MNRDELKQRLDALSAKLVEKGYVDVKFHADYTAGFDKVAEDAITVLEAILDGRTTPMPPLGDSVRDKGCINTHVSYGGVMVSLD